MKGRSYRTYLVTLLAIILAFNYVDRLFLALALQDIKADFRLTDSQLGLLSGIAFALFYSLMGVPIARLADRSNRAKIITVTTLLWSVAVALCGLVQSFVQLLSTRVLVAVGEAGCIPPAHSLIADYFSRSERAKAVAHYMLGVPLSVLIGYFVAGWLNQFYGWRLTFVTLSIPGIVLALIAGWSLQEPRNRVGASPTRPLSVHVMAKSLWRNRTFRHLVLGYAVLYFFTYGIGQWQPAFFIRSYGLKTGELGTWFGIIYGVGGLIGTYWGGWLATRYASGNERLQLRGVAVAYCGLSILTFLTYLSPTAYVAFPLMAVAAIGVYTTTGPLFATIQTLVPDPMRATAVAVIYLFANLVGMGLGPLAAGVLSEALQPVAGQESLRYALLLLCPGYLWGAWHLWWASGTVEADQHELSDAR